MSLTNRQCTVEIQNLTSRFTLCEPCAYLISGNCESPFSPFLGPSMSGTALFKKTANTACGSVAILTFDILGSPIQEKDRLAVMFSNPYDFTFYSNYYAIGLFSKDKQCDKGLYDEMYYGEEVNFVRGKASGPSLTYKAGDLIIRASMSDSYQPILKLDICDI
ncbi:PREDICTED: DELTA-stichotoxin-Hmg2b-like [Cyprinodon variegatus]|nr:PREDICTED: DELTA-stichotoxin-Hmg2b-like [Cyprinodon variegatus]